MLITNIILRFKIIVVISLIYFVGCQNNKVQTTKNEQFINLNIDTLQDIDYSFTDFFNKIEIITLETNKNCLVGNIDQIEIFGDTLFILDRHISKSLFLFSLDGNFINRIGKIGKGPGEYLDPASFELNKKKQEVYLFDAQSCLINTYNFKGEFINAHKGTAPFTRDFTNIGNRFFFYYEKRNDYMVSSSYSNNPNSINNYWLNYKIHNKGFDKLLHLDSRDFYHNEVDSKLSLLFCDTIFRLNEKGLCPYIIVSHDNTIPTKVVDKIKNSDFDPNIVFNHDYFWGIHNYLESSDMIFFKFYYKKKGINILFSKKSNDVILTSTLTDNIFNINDKIGYRRDLFLHNNKLITTYLKLNINSLKENIDSNNWISAEDKIRVNELKDDANPILVLYYFKDDISISKKIKIN